MESRFLSKVEKLLKKESPECYVLMVCNKSMETNELLVDMTYEGDEALGCYMLENALSIMNEKIKDKQESDLPNEPLS